MARIRTIKPEFPQSESIGRLSREARLLFIQLWTIVDDSGRTRAASRVLASLLYPYDEDVFELIEAWLGELESESMIHRYQVDGKSYLQISKWHDHQKIDRPSPSKIPRPIEDSRVLDGNHRTLPVVSVSVPVPRKGSGSIPVASVREDGSLGEVITEAVCSHPKAVLKAWTSLDVPQADAAHCLDAVHAESQTTGCSLMVAAEMIRDRTRMLAEKVPRAEWRFFKPPGEFFRLRDYRLEPENFGRSKPNGKYENPFDAARRRIDEEEKLDQEANSDVGGVEGGQAAF